MSSSVESRRSTRLGLESDDLRRRLRAIGALSVACCASKTEQLAVGAFLREPQSIDPQKRLLEIVVSELRGSDRTLRCASARLICQLAYENLVNQESITQLTKGFSVGWLYVFSIPQAFCDRTINPRGTSSRPTSSGFIEEIIVDNYGEVYQCVTSYYANGCQQFLPLWWQYPRDTSIDRANSVPDPADHILGFYLVPRQTQFTEHDEIYEEDLLQSLGTVDRDRLGEIKRAFKHLTHNSVESVPVVSFIAFCEESATVDSTSLKWLVESVSGDAVAPLQTYSNSTDELTWSQVFIFACQRLNYLKLMNAFDATTARIFARIFQDVAFCPGKQINHKTYVWLPVLVGAVLQRPDLPPAFKRQVQSLFRGSLQFQAPHKKEPWRFLLQTRLEQTTPVSWTVCLAQWRVAAEMEQRLGESKSLSARRTSVCSVGDLRRSIVEHLHPQSFRDLDQLRRELPKVSRYASHPDLNCSDTPSLSSFREENSPNEEEVACYQEDQGKNSLAYHLSLFHRIQHSLSELDTIGLQNFHERQEERDRILRNVALNRQKAQEAAEQRRRDLFEKERQQEANYADLEARKAAERAKAHELQQQKHQFAAHRKQLQDAAQEEYQQQLAEKIAQRDQELLSFRKLREQRCHEEPIKRPTPPVSSRRPLSARSLVSSAPREAAALSPDVLRRRALLYGRVVSKIYTAETVGRIHPSDKDTKTIHQPHHLARSFSVYSSSSFNVKAPIVKVTPPSARRRLSPRHHRSLYRRVGVSREEEGDEYDGAAQEANEEEGRAKDSCTVGTPRPSRHQAADHSLGTHDNLCSTLVMQNAAQAVSERIHIPEIPAPHVDDPAVAPFVIAAQYEALDDQYKLNFKRRFNLKCVSHRLSYDVLKQYTKIVRRDMAWQAFHDKCSSGLQSQVKRIKYADFVAVAQFLGIDLSERKLLHVAKQLDPKKTGYVEWKAFYTWWSMQYTDQVVAPSQRKTG